MTLIDIQNQRVKTPIAAMLEKLEKDAREAKKGLWIDLAPIPPWMFRKEQQKLIVDCRSDYRRLLHNFALPSNQYFPA